MKKIIINLLKTIKQFGIDPIIFIRGISSLSFYLRSYFKFRKNYDGKINFYPCLHDHNQEGGETKGEYFWQDLVVARWIYEAAPQKHVDIGSRVDGFVAHVAAFREIEVLDVRPITTNIPGVIFRQADLMDKSFSSNFKEDDYCDSLSCLHAIEHFGLGRYGDKINPQGYRLGLENMAKLLCPAGKLYLSTPIGKERVEFNANWVFDPRTIVEVASKNRLELKSLTIFNKKQGIKLLEPNSDNLLELSKQDYNLGIFTFIKSTKEK